MKIFIDTDCKCHVSNPVGIYTEIEAPKQFNDKCSTYIEGFRVRPDGYTYSREDGKVFGPVGYFVGPWKPISELEAAQAQYERMMAEAENAYREGVNSVD